MHGVTKADLYDVSEEKKAARAKKTEQYKMLAAEVLRRRTARIYDEQSLGMTSKFLEVNPECYTVWNFRREMLAAIFAKLSEDERRAACEKELLFLEGALMKNPKAYTTWEHRLWTVRKHGAIAAAELALCDKFLKFDERNFHCWGYRRHMAALAAATPQDELTFTSTKVENNFSNYSAWHSRTKLLPAVHTDRAALQAALAKEFETLQAAFFTEPDDQSCWFYHQWLVAASRPRDCSTAAPSIRRIASWYSDNLGEPVVAVAFNRPVSGVAAALSIETCPGDGGPAATPLSGTWSSVSETSPGYATVWIFTPDNLVPPGTTLALCPASGTLGTPEILVDLNGVTTSANAVLETAVPHRLDGEHAEEYAASKVVVEQQLAVLEELLEVEEGCKWALYTQTQLLQELAALEDQLAASDASSNPDTARQQRLQRLSAVVSDGPGSALAAAVGPQRERVLANLASLAEIDPWHKHQFLDLRSSQAIEGVESVVGYGWNAHATPRLLLEEKGTRLQLQLCLPIYKDEATFESGLLVGAGLTRLGRLEGLIALQELDLSDNEIESLVEADSGDFARMPFLKKLILDGNRLQSLHGMSWPTGLAHFSAARNQIIKIGRVKGGGTDTVTYLGLGGNPVCSDGGEDGGADGAVHRALSRAGLKLPMLETLCTTA